MNNWIRGMLGLTAVAALTACGQQQESAKVDLQGLQEVAQGVARGETRLSVQTLSHRLIEGHQDFVLIDIRKPDAFTVGHIKGAENLPLAELMSEAKLAALPKERQLIVYSQGSSEAAAAAALLRLAGRTAVAVTGGFDAWDKQILHPQIPPVATVNEDATTAEKRAIACYFIGGKGAPSEAPVYAPKPAPAYVPPVTTAPPPKRHRGEGC